MSKPYQPEGSNPFEEDTQSRRKRYSASLNPFENDSSAIDYKTSHPETRLLKTIGLYVAFFALGFTHNSMGPTLVQMELYLDTDTHTLSWVFTGFSVGYIIGSVLCGLLFDRLNAELTLMISGVGVGLTFAIGPFAGGLYGYIAFMVACGIFSGFIDAAGNGYTVSLWEGTKWKEPALQASHMFWSVGGALGPLVVRPFLKELHFTPEEGGNCFKDTNATAQPSTELIQKVTTLVEVVSLNTSHSPMHPGYTHSDTGLMSNSSYSPDISIDYGSVKFAYLTLGLISLIAPVLFAVVFICNGPTLLRKSSEKTKKKEEADDDRSHQSRCFVLTMFSLMFMFYFFYLVLEVSPGNFLSPFTIKELCWANSRGAMIISVLWASHGVGRLIGVPISMIVPPRLMLIGDLTLQVLAYLLMFFVHFHPAIMWISAALLGLGMSTTFATGILWLSKYIKITGVSSAVIMIGSSAGSITSPLFVGYLFDSHSPMWLIYIGTAAAILQVVSYIAADIFARKKFVNRHYNAGHDVGGATAYKASEMEPVKEEKHFNF